MRIFQLISTYLFTWVDQIGLEVRSGSCTGSAVRKDSLNGDVTRRSIDKRKIFRNFKNVPQFLKRISKIANSQYLVQIYNAD